jgi:membrane protein implicated in regulation of membrane protease activity
MSAETRFDIRLPIGALFLLLGLILLAYGVVTRGDTALYIRSESIDVNLWWGLIMVVFGAIMFYFGSRAPKRPLHSAEGESTEAREHRLGLERER